MIYRKHDLDHLKHDLDHDLKHKHDPDHALLRDLDHDLDRDLSGVWMFPISLVCSSTAPTMCRRNLTPSLSRQIDRAARLLQEDTRELEELAEGWSHAFGELSKELVVSPRSTL